MGKDGTHINYHYIVFLTLASCFLCYDIVSHVATYFSVKQWRGIEVKAVPPPSLYLESFVQV